MRGSAARRRAHEATVAARAERETLGRLDPRGKVQPAGVHTKQLSRQGRGGTTSVGFGGDDVKDVRRGADDDCAALVEGFEVRRHRPD